MSTTCAARTTSGEPCGNPPSPGLTVCRKHGGATAASKRKATAKVAVATLQGLWGVATSGEGVDPVANLRTLAAQAMRDVQAIRTKIAEDPESYIGMLNYEESTEVSEDGFSEKRKRRSGAHPLVAELHRAEDYAAKCLQALAQAAPEVRSAEDERRELTQAVLAALRTKTAYPGISDADVLREVFRNG